MNQMLRHFMGCLSHRTIFNSFIFLSKTGWNSTSIYLRLQQISHSSSYLMMNFVQNAVKVRNVGRLHILFIFCSSLNQNVW